MNRLSLAWCVLLMLVMAATAVYGLEPAAGRLLVAQRALTSPYFARTVVYLLQHDVHGSSGVVLNRPLEKSVAEVLPQLRNHAMGAFTLYEGGPVSQDILVMLMRGNYRDAPAVHVDGDVYASSNRAMLARLMQSGKPPTALRLFAGQAGWVHGQLQQELQRDSWFVLEADPEQLFEADGAGLWDQLINRVDPPGILVQLGQQP